MPITLDGNGGRSTRQTAAVTDDVPSRKAALRRELLAARAQRDDADRTRAAAAIASHGLAAWRDIGTVAAYVSFGHEPPTLPLLDDLRAAGVTILLPVIGDEQLDWATYTGTTDLAVGSRGIPEPTGRRLGPAAISDAGVVVVPALALDPRGNRLGRGAGYYDRALPAVTTDTVAVVFEEELLAEVPHEPHDVPVAAALTPHRITRFSS
jgi:5-formyltetrahydrofolate cyclo-ligase